MSLRVHDEQKQIFVTWLVVSWRLQGTSEAVYCLVYNGIHGQHIQTGVLVNVQSVLFCLMLGGFCVLGSDYEKHN